MRTWPFLSLACRFVTGEEEKSSYKCFGQSESLDKMMILTRILTFTSIVAVPVSHLH